MTRSQYKRLLIVSTAPLLLLGGGISYLFKGPTFIQTLCSGDERFENCRNVGPVEAGLYNVVKNQTSDAQDWFQVIVEATENTLLNYSIEAVGRPIGNVVVDAGVPFLTGDDAKAYAAIEDLKGRDARMRLGRINGTVSSELPTPAHLFCNTIEFDSRPTPHFSNSGPYVATCSFKNWSGRLSLTPDSEAKQRLDSLRQAVSVEILNTERKNIYVHILNTALPLAVFLILSGVTWMVLKAARYVRLG